MDQSLPPLSEVFLGDDPAQPLAGPDGDPAAWIRLGSPYLTLRSLRLVGLLCALILGLASISRSLAAREEASPSDGAATAVRADSGVPDHGARLRSGSSHRSHPRLPAVPKIIHAFDPNDDTTSGEPDEDDDDETSKFLNGFNDTDAPITGWLEEMAPCAIPCECAPVTRIAPPASPFLTLQRLLC